MSSNLELDGVRRRFGSFSLEVTLSAGAGDYLVLLGPSGCGKSLLLGTVAGIYVPDSGRVLLDGRDVTALHPEERGLGMVPQGSSLFPHLSVEGNIEFGLRVRGQPRTARRERVRELAASLRLEPLLGRPVPALSGGEAQRVAIARALASRPGLLLLDEPLSLLDHNARLELQEELRRIHAALGLTVLHVTHSREEARALGRRCAVMLGGRLVQVGTADEIFARPRCRFVARFLGLAEASSPPGEAGAPPCGEPCLSGGPGRCDRPYSGESDR
jgi:ABC-type sugar transport system ATPase subunit